MNDFQTFKAVSCFDLWKENTFRFLSSGGHSSFCSASATANVSCWEKRQPPAAAFKFNVGESSTVCRGIGVPIYHMPFFPETFSGAKQRSGGNNTCPESNSVFEPFGLIKIISFSSHRLAVEFLPTVVALLKCYHSHFPIWPPTFLAACDFFGC